MSLIANTEPSGCPSRRHRGHAAIILPFEVLDGLRASIISITEPFVHTGICRRLFADVLRVDPPEPN